MTWVEKGLLPTGRLCRVIQLLSDKKDTPTIFFSLTHRIESCNVISHHQTLVLSKFEIQRLVLLKLMVLLGWRFSACNGFLCSSAEFEWCVIEPLGNSVQFGCSVMHDSLQPHGLQYVQVSLSVTDSWSLLKLTSIESVMPSNHLILCRPLLLLPSIFPSIRVFTDESALGIRWPKDWSFSFSISPSNEHPGLICFRMDWLDLLAVQGTLKSRLQHHSSKASV